MEVLSEIIQDYPDVKIRLVSGNADEMETALKHGTIDFAVLMAHRSLDSYHHLQLPETDRWGLAMQKDNPLAQKNVIGSADLIGLPLLVSEQALDKHRFQDWWGNVGKEINIIGTYTLVFNAELMVKQGSAYILTFDNLLNTSNNSELTFRPLSPSISESTNIIWKKNVTQSKVAKLFTQRLLASLDQNNNINTPVQLLRLIVGPVMAYIFQTKLFNILAVDNDLEIVQQQIINNLTKQGSWH